MSDQEPPGEIVVHRLPVSVDDAWIEQAGPALRVLAAHPRVRVLSFDATDLLAIDARGVGLLTALRLLAEQRGAAVTIRHYPPTLSGVLEAARLAVGVIPDQTPHPAAGSGQTDPPAWWTAAASNA